MVTINYEVDVNTKKQEFNREAWEYFLQYRTLKESFEVSSVIYDGWKRSYLKNIDPLKKSVQRILSDDELSELKEIYSFFLEVSRPALENLMNFVHDSGFIVAISDKEGILLEVFGDNSVLESTKRGNWTPGADWSESSIGNNSIGTSIYLKKPIMLIGYEHYSRCCHYWASAASPIFDNEGKLMGSIALCGRYEKIHPHTLGMIIAASHDITKQMALRKAFDERESAYNNQKVLMNSIEDGVIGIDNNHIISYCNKRIFDILHISPTEIIGTTIDSIVDTKYINYFLKSTTDLNNEEVVFKVNEHSIRCICTTSNISDNSKSNGSILIIKDYNKAVSVANKLVGLNNSWTFNSMIGTNKQHLGMVEVAKIAARMDKSILIQGESGTGKDVFAQSIHQYSNRKNKPFIAINCGAIPKELISSELFGFDDGAFTGAKKGGNKGKFEMANGGTLFLDEIGDMPIDQQVVLLRVLEESSINKIGSSVNIPVDVRIIAATSKNLIEEIKNKTFRQDLFYRLNVFTIIAIPLRDRKEDIEDLSNSFLKKSALKYGFQFDKISPKVLSKLHDYNWPGNIRELHNVLERAFAISRDGNIQPEMIHFIPSQLDTISENITTDNKTITSNKVFEKDEIISILKDHNWNLSKTCKHLNISRPTIYRWLKKYNIEINRNQQKN